MLPFGDIVPGSYPLVFERFALPGFQHESQALGIFHKLAITFLASMILIAIMNGTLFLGRNFKSCRKSR